MSREFCLTLKRDEAKMGEQEKTQEALAPGRRRSDQSHQAILQAAREVLNEVGYRDMTIEAIAARAAVGKKTIYRWWSSKAAVVLEALTSQTSGQVPFSDTGSLEGDLLTYFELSFPGLRGKAGTVLSGLAAEAQLNPEFAHEFQRTFIVPRKQELVVLLQRGIQRGELASDTNLEVLADLIYGAKWYRFLLYPAPLDEAFAREIVKLILRLRSET
jgi:AcrR family transcriptional regulator